MSNNDNAMTRFLFAILRQKNLKDIDWNQVAQDPILSQTITNGHAARMRYSRFRSSMLGLEPQRRNKTNPDKSRVTKSKKNAKTKKEESVKPEPVAEPPKTAGPSEQKPSTPKIKQEASHGQNVFDSRLTPAPLSSAPSPATQQLILPRLLTPCSDTDSYMAAQPMTSSPTTEMPNASAPFDFSTPPYVHEPSIWAPGSIYPSFHTPFEFDAYAIPSDTGMEDTNVKHEGWDEHCT